MSTKPNYFKIGVFVILATALIFGAVVVFGAGLFAQEKMYFETYFNEAVSGLSIGSPIELRGVNIAQVEKIAFVAKTYGHLVDTPAVSKYGLCVVVVGSIPRENWQGLNLEQSQSLLLQMVARGLRFQITSNLLTGQSYLQADYYDPERYPPLEIDWQPENIYIPSIPSDLTTLRDTLNRLQKLDVESFLDSLDKAINDANIDQVSQEAVALLSEARLKVRAVDTETLSASAKPSPSLEAASLSGVVKPKPPEVWLPGVRMAGQVWGMLYSASASGGTRNKPSGDSTHQPKTCLPPLTS